MKKIYMGVAVVISSLVVGCSNSSISVNGVEITKEDYEKTFEIILATDDYLDKIPGENIENQIKYFMINNEVVYQVAKENGFTCNEEELKLKYAEIEASINSNSSYKAKIQSIGVNEGYILTEIKKDLVIQKYRNNFEQNINITEEDLKKYYNQNIDKFKFEEVNPSHILISSKYEKGKLIKIAQEILYKINDGESFEKLAIKYSDDRESGKNGGNLGYLKKGDKNIEFSNIAFKLGKGEISNIIETSYGYHIIKLNDRKEYIESFEDSREDIKKFILDEKYKEHVEKLNKNADIKVK